MRQPSSASLAKIGSFVARVLRGKGEGQSGTALEIVYGNSLNNELAGSSEFRKPVVLAGGKKDDLYSISSGQLAIVADGLGGKKDTLDLTALNRAEALWGQVQIGKDTILVDVISGTAILLHDPLGERSGKNRIEWVKAQSRDSVTGEVDDSSSENVPLRDWLSGAISFNSALGIAAFKNYNEYNAALENFRTLDASGQLDSFLSESLPSQYTPLATAVANVVRSLPISGEVGLVDDAAVEGAWVTLTKNLGVLA